MKCPGLNTNIFFSTFSSYFSVAFLLQISTYVFMAALTLADMFVIAASTVTALVCLFFTDIHVCVHGGPGSGRHVCYRGQYSDGSSLFVFLQISTYVFMAALALVDMFVIAASTVTALVCLFLFRYPRMCLWRPWLWQTCLLSQPVQ